MAICIWRESDGFSGDLSWSAASDPAPAPTLTAGWDLRDNILHARADRYGVIPLYIGDGPKGRAVGNSVVDVAAAVGALPNDTAIAVFLHMGYLLENDTMFSGVRALGPGEEMSISSTGISTTRAPKIDAPTPLAGLSSARVIDTLRDLTRQSIERRLPDPALRYAVPLSGGRDSRHIVLQSIASGRAPDFVATHRGLPPFRGSDVATAQTIARHTGLAHRVSGIDYAEFFAETVEKNTLTDFQTDEQHWYLPFAKSLAGEVDVIMDGLAGDTLVNNVTLHRSVIPLLRRGAIDEAADKMVGRGKALCWMKRAYRKRFSRDRARHRIWQMLRSIADAPNPAKELHFRNKARRSNALAPMRLYRDHIPAVALPFLDADVVNFSRALPFEEHGAVGQHDEIIAGILPKFADLPYETRAQRFRLSPQDDRALRDGFLALRTEYGSGQFESAAFIQPRLMCLNLGTRPLRAFWWMCAWAQFRGLERAMANRGIAL